MGGNDRRGICSTGSRASLMDTDAASGQRQYKTTTECSALRYSSTCKLKRLMESVFVCLGAFVSLCVGVPVSSLHRRFWIWALRLQADSLHLGRLQCLMGFRFSQLGTFCRDIQHSAIKHNCCKFDASYY